MATATPTPVPLSPVLEPSARVLTLSVAMALTFRAPAVSRLPPVLT